MPRASQRWLHLQAHSQHPSHPYTLYSSKFLNPSYQSHSIVFFRLLCSKSSKLLPLSDFSIASRASDLFSWKFAGMRGSWHHFGVGVISPFQKFRKVNMERVMSRYQHLQASCLLLPLNSQQVRQLFTDSKNSTVVLQSTSPSSFIHFNLPQASLDSRVDCYHAWFRDGAS